MSKHTPGPWFAMPDPNSSNRDDWCIGIEGGPIDEVAVCSKRDAMLIASAPELLKALKNIDTEFTKHGRQHWPEAVKARAAIKKAEGA
jgi:hypothetical protein